MNKFKKKLKGHFITGVVVIMPLGLTAWIVYVLFRFVGTRFLPLLEKYPLFASFPIVAQMLMSILITVFIIWLVGFFAKNLIGRSLLKWLEKILLKTPVVSRIYKTIRKLTDSMFVNKQAFKEVALVEYPRKGLYTLAFITNEDIDNKGVKNLTTVFIPSTPNPTTGYCIILPSKDVKKINISVNQAMEFIFSGGILVPGNMDFPEFEPEEL
ncbi:MAG: DUF502 domain-containing protein [Elusimicrobia bacterium]|nr:DUF502 domain-containing protein [Elusimicrobiota bacterium]